MHRDRSPVVLTRSAIMTATVRKRDKCWHIEIIQLLNSDIGMPAKHTYVCHVHMYVQLVIHTYIQRVLMVFLFTKS